MPIQGQSNPNIPYLKNYTPFQFASTIAICDSVEDMISYSIVPNDLSIVEYYVGAADNMQLTMNVKNITEETALKVRLDYDSNVFDVTSIENSSVETILAPKVETGFNIRVNKDGLNSKIDYQIIQSKLQLIVTNLVNGKIAIKSTTAPLLPQRKFPRRIVIQ